MICTVRFVFSVPASNKGDKLREEEDKIRNVSMHKPLKQIFTYILCLIIRIWSIIVGNKL